MEYYVGLMWIGLELLITLLFQASFLKKKRKNKPTIFISLLLWPMLLWVRNIPTLESISSILSFFIVFLLSYYIFDGKWYIHLFLQIIILLFISITDTTVSYGTSAFLHITLSDLVWMKSTYSFVGTIGKLFVLLCVWLLYRLKHVDGFSGIQGKWFALTIFFPVVSLVILALNYYNNFGSKDLSPQIVAISIILALANIGIIYLIHNLEQATLHEQEFVLLKQQMEHQQESYMALENSYRLQRKSSHDFERHLQTLYELLARNKFDTAKEYIAQLRRDRTLKIHCINTHHPVIDVILNQKYQMARECSINMQVQISDLSLVKIQTDALVVLFSNLLDNAIEACQKLPDHREIRCRILYQDNLYISISNTSPPVQIENDTLATDKSQRIDHGYGIPAVKYVLDKLNAEYTFAYRKNWFQFVAEIPIS